MVKKIVESWHESLDDENFDESWFSEKKHFSMPFQSSSKVLWKKYSPLYII
jgi:hypothetical protein